MSKAYVPPHLRDGRAKQNISSEADADGLYSGHQIADHFATPDSGTLGATSNTNTLSRILIFKNQHPQYPPKIFVKTNLGLLFHTNGSGGIRSEILEESFQIPLFTQNKRSQGNTFEFFGWVNIKDVQRLQRNSPELVEMLTEKWKSGRPRRGWGSRGSDGGPTTTTYDADDDAIRRRVEETRPRSESAWKSSLSVDWAVITLEKVSDRNDNPMNQPRVMPPKEHYKLSKDLTAVEANDCVDGDEEDDDDLQKLTREDYEQPSPPSSSSTSHTTPTKSLSSATLSAFAMTKISAPTQPLQSPSVHSELIDSISSLAPSLILSPLDSEESSNENIRHGQRPEYSQRMCSNDSFTTGHSGISIVDSDNEETLDDDSDRWSELSSGPMDKNWQVVDDRDPLNNDDHF